jgi:hypothetical protein
LKFAAKLTPSWKEASHNLPPLSIRALEWVDRAYAKHDDSLIYTKVDRLLKNSHGDAGCTAFVKKLNLPTD